MAIYKVPQLAWYGPRDFDIVLPDDWEVDICYMNGYNRPALSSEELKEAIQKPLGTPPLREMARGKKDVAIVFDDTSRVTRTAKIVPHVLKELAEAGIADSRIRFICGLGVHGPLSRLDLAKKLGVDVVGRYRCFNHNPFGNCIYVGTTSALQTKVYINEEYMKCDLKIIIGGCVPHPSAGFGGGSKMILPGLASYESIRWNHLQGGAINYAPSGATGKPVIRMGNIEGNIFRQDIDEAAEMAGIDFMIIVLVNLWGETVSLYAGDWKVVQEAAFREAKEHYRTPVRRDKDIVICNNYAKANEATVGYTLARPVVSKKGGDVVLITNAPEGQVTHYLAGPFGRETFAELHAKVKVPDYINQMIVFSEYPHPGSSWFQEHEKIVYLSDWSDVMERLKSSHGPGTRVAVIPDGTNQYFAVD